MEDKINDLKKKNPFLKKEGVVEYLQKLGFSSKKEYDAYSVVDAKALSIVYTSDNRKLIRKFNEAFTKEQKLEIYQKLGLLEYLNKALTMDKEELLMARLEGLKQGLPHIKEAQSKEEQKIDNMVEEYKRKH